MDDYDAFFASDIRTVMDFARLKNAVAARNDTATDAYFDYLAAEQKRTDALQTLQTVSRLLEDRTVPIEGVQRLLAGAEDTLKKLSDSHEGLLAYIPAIYRKPPNSARLAQKAFDIPELLEHVLQYLDVMSLLQAQTVSRTWRHAIQSSVKIQRKLGLLADAQCRLRFPLHHIYQSFFTIYTDVRPCYGKTADGDNIFLSIQEIHWHTEKRPDYAKVGARCRAMLICQPPVTRIEGFADCCSGSIYGFSSARQNRQHGRVIENAAGITYGDLIDAMVAMLDEHKLCPSASSYLHDKEGFVKPGIYFETTVPVRYDDPMLVEKRRRQAEKTEKDREDSLFQARLTPYIAAKRTAHAAGQPIVSMAEWERANAAPDNGDQDS